MGFIQALSRDSATGFLSALRTPGYRRTLAFRRGLAAILAVTAVMSLVGSRITQHPSVVTYAAPVAPGTVLTESDVGLSRIPEEFVPDNAVATLDDVVGHVTTAHGSVGQPITSVQLLGKELTASSVTHFIDEIDASVQTMVPIKLAEPDIIPLLHPGDEVSIVSTTGQDASPDVIATGGRVVFAGETPSDASPTNAETVLLLLPENIAPSVASASLASPLTVVLTGPRTQF